MMSDAWLLAQLELSVGRAASRILGDLATERNSADVSGMDRLQIGHAPLVPEIELHLAVDAILLWARLEAQLKTRLTAPFWATAWVGGQALARYILDHPQTVRGQRVLDLGAGSGLVAIAAAKAGATHIVANDIDLYATTAVAMNARLNRVRVVTDRRNLLAGDAAGFDVVLAGDALYESALADGMLAYLRRANRRGRRVLVGDPHRGHLPDEGLTRLASYPIASLGTLSDAQIVDVSVFELASAR
jgi:predicted nicotinamide N-methyase